MPLTSDEDENVSVCLAPILAIGHSAGTRTGWFGVLVAFPDRVLLADGIY